MHCLARKLANTRTSTSGYPPAISTDFPWQSPLMGVDRIFPWPGDRPWNFVLHDGRRHRVDLHLYEDREDGQIHYGSALAGDVFPAAALDGCGKIGAQSVRCESPEWALRWHTGYP